MDDTCETCRFAKINWRKGDKYMYGYSAPVEVERPTTSIQCRIRAPQFSQNENREDGWPLGDGDDWCGEHQPKPENAT